MKKTFLLFGAQGMLGAEMFNTSLERDDIELIPYSRFNIDIKDEVAVQEGIDMVMKKIEISGVINTAAYTNVDKCETQFEKTSSEAWNVNALAPGYIANACKKHDIPLFHFSTDYVFAGETDQKFIESSDPNPINEYGRGKLVGETAVLEYEKGYIFRTAWLAGEYGQSFVNKMVHMLKTIPKIKIITNEFGNPSFCTDITESCFSFVLQEKLPKERIFHMVNEGSASRKELVMEIKNFLELSGEIIPVKSFELPAPRPISSILTNTLLPALPDWKTGLHNLLEKEKKKLDKKRVIEVKKQRAKDLYRAQQAKLREKK